MSYVLSVPNFAATAHDPRRKPPRIWFDGYVSKKEGAWAMTTKLEQAHRWKTVEKAEAAAIKVVLALPSVMGKLNVVEVEKTGDNWHRKRSARDW